VTNDKRGWFRIPIFTRAGEPKRYAVGEVTGRNLDYHNQWILRVEDAETGRVDYVKAWGDQMEPAPRPGPGRSSFG
jgi:hypothetical protein